MPALSDYQTANRCRSRRAGSAPCPPAATWPWRRSRTSAPPVRAWAASSARSARCSRSRTPWPARPELPGPLERPGTHPADRGRAGQGEPRQRRRHTDGTAAGGQLSGLRRHRGPSAPGRRRRPGLPGGRPGPGRRPRATRTWSAPPATATPRHRSRWAPPTRSRRAPAPSRPAPRRAAPPPTRSTCRRAPPPSRRSTRRQRPEARRQPTERAGLADHRRRHEVPPHRRHGARRARLRQRRAGDAADDGAGDAADRACAERGGCAEAGGGGPRFGLQARVCDWRLLWPRTGLRRCRVTVR